MRDEILATLFHKISTDEKPQREKCPAGEASWCSWERSKALGSLATYQHKPAMHEDVFKVVKPIYEELSSDDLLSRCLGRYTQNTNESFNAVVWSIAPKNVSSGKAVLDIATDIAVVLFNDGLSGLLPIYDSLGLTARPNSYDFCLETDAERIKAAERSISDDVKEVRRGLLASRKDEEEKSTVLEGQLYGAGIAE